MVKERDDAWCHEYFGEKYHILASTFRGKIKGGQDCVTDDLMNNIYNNCIVGFNLKCRKKEKKYDWRMIYVKFDFKGEIRRGTSEPCENFSKKTL